MNKQWQEFGITKQDSWSMVGELAIELSSSNDPTTSYHGDIWIDQCMCVYSINDKSL
jgi:hypothetical protein